VEAHENFIHALCVYIQVPKTYTCAISNRYIGIAIMLRRPTRSSWQFASFLIVIALFLTGSLPTSAQSSTIRIHRVETEFPPIILGHNQPPLRTDLQQLMTMYKVPAISIAVIDNFKIEWTKAYGFADAGGKNAVTTTTLFQAGSISKPVTSTAALYLVERGKLSLDEDVNRKLVSWKVPENEFTKEQKVTLRRLLNHSSGADIEGGFNGYDIDDPLPTLKQTLNGQKPANHEAIRIDFVPGSRWQYSGGGYLILQQLMSDVTGKPLPQLMREVVFDKIGMADSTFEQPLPSARAAMAASGTFPDGTTVHGKWHVYPEMAAAGLWTTPTDLAKFVIEIALSKQGKSNRILSQSVARQMLTPQIDMGAIPWNTGLGFFLNKEDQHLFGHNGSTWAYRAIVLISTDTGKGVAIMTNSDNGFYLSDLLIESVAKEYTWKTDWLGQNSASLLFFITMARGADAGIRKYRDLKESKSTAVQFLDESTLPHLGHDLLENGKTQEAISIFKANLQEYPKSASAYDGIGEAYSRSGRKDLAIESYENALKLDPHDQNATESLRNLKRNP
jgi:CubicO group peptidase (beta-lactamase class C family)